jgi:hypothetical protein
MVCRSEMRANSKRVGVSTAVRRRGMAMSFPGKLFSWKLLKLARQQGLIRGCLYGYSFVWGIRMGTPLIMVYPVWCIPIDRPIVCLGKVVIGWLVER